MPRSKTKKDGTSKKEATKEAGSEVQGVIFVCLKPQLTTFEEGLWSFSALQLAGLLFLKFDNALIPRKCTGTHLGPRCHVYILLIKMVHKK